MGIVPPIVTKNERENMFERLRRTVGRNQLSKNLLLVTFTNVIPLDSLNYSAVTCCDPSLMDAETQGFEGLTNMTKVTKC